MQAQEIEDRPGIWTVTDEDDREYVVEAADAASAQAAAEALRHDIGATLVRERIRAVLAASDVWAARHVEDGISLTPARIAYRQELRALLDSVATSTDPDSITIPDLPPPPKP